MAIASGSWQAVLATVLVIAMLGCGSGSKPTAAKPSAPAANPAPSSPPAPTAAATPTPAPAQPAAAGDVPAWAGQRPDEPFDVKQFLASRAAPADNAAPHYERALALISGDLGGEGAAALERQILERSNLEQLAAGAISPAQIEQTLAAAAAAIKQLDAAQARPQCVFVTGLSADSLLPHAQAARNVPRIATLQLAHARSKGDFDLAEAAIRRSLRLSRDLRPRGSLVCQLVSIASDGSLLSAVERLTLNDPNLSPEHCNRLLALLIEHGKGGLICFDEGMRMDYIMVRNTIEDLRTGRLTLSQIYEFQGIESTGSNVAGQPPMNYEAEIIACNRLYSLILKTTNGNASPGVDALNEYQTEISRLKKDWEVFKKRMAETAPADRPALVGQLPATQFAFGRPRLEAPTTLRDASWPISRACKCSLRCGVTS